MEQVNNKHASGDDTPVRGSVQQYEDTGLQPQKRSKGAWLKAHVKKYWWAHLLFVCCAVALAVPLLIFIGVKNIAQSKINHATLDVLGISVINTTPTSFIMSINTTLRSGTTKATVAPFNGTLYLEDADQTPFATLLFPETKNQRFQYINISQEVDIASVPALTRFNTFLLMNETTRVTVDGNTTVRVPGISKKYNVRFKKTVSLAGLQGFDGIVVDNSSVNINNFTDGTNFHTTSYIPNRSVVTFEIGNVTFASFFNGSQVGFSYLDNVTLRPGNNTFPLRAQIKQGPILSGVTTEPFCGNGSLPIELSGRVVQNNGQDLSYFADALANYNTTVPVDMGTPLRKLGLPIACPKS